MCGINLIYSQTDEHIERSRIAAMNGALVHRGPDDNDIYADAHVAFGHTRLSIVDVAHGHQPMVSADGRFVIVFNGEVYNYRSLRRELGERGTTFHTDSDTEVVLELFARDGLTSIAELRGMFAFSIYDRQEQCCHVVRDRLGIKPVFYNWAKGVLTASSEAKGIFASGLVEPKLNMESIRDFFFFQFSVSPHTSFEGIYELPPGHWLTIAKSGEPKLHQYWDIEFPRDGDYESHDENYWIRAFSDELSDATESHLIGEVPIGAYLSGGIDSSALAWLLKTQYKDQLKTFSIHFSNAAMDESAVYRRTANHLDVQNIELVMDDDRPEGFLSDLEACIYHLEQPQRLAVDIPHFLLSGLVRENKYKVVYTGDGADELLGGYDCFRQDVMRVWGNAIKDPTARRHHYLTEYTQWFSQDYIEMLLELHETQDQQDTIDRFGCYPVWHDFWHILEDFATNIFSKQSLEQTRERTQFGALVDTMRPRLEQRHPLNQSLYIESKTRLPGWILWKSDRLSMAHSVEARVPYVDHKLFEFAARLPPDLKLRDMDEKFVLKQVARPHLPTHPADHKKRAFYTPIREWFFTKKRAALIDNYIGPEAIDRAGIFDPDQVTMLRRELENVAPPADSNSYYRIMKLEWTLMLVLSTQVLHVLYVEKNAPCFKQLA